jgi:hypothetical protein
MLIFATSKASSEISNAYPFISNLMFLNIDVIIAELHVQTSIKVVSVLISFNAFSTKISVSFLGTKTL